MKSIKALQWRYATKKFDSEKMLPQEKVEILKKAFNLTATSYGLQPLKLVVVENKELQEEMMKASNNQKQIGTASQVFVICIEKQIDKTFIENYFNYVRRIRNTPEEVLNPFKNFLIEDFEGKPLQEIKKWATNQAYLVMGTLLTVCAVEEIDSCPMEGFESEKYDKLLGLDERNLQSVLVLPVGYRATDDQFAGFKKVRRPLEETVIEI
ncbi:NAD(P)H-dependent oxidoreductase [Salinimicrobium sp. GXAS 041]|uniref:NAD(P)H-dependent oxidoreductase n=1 Tax=Salinimicrobium sp. GXAS 041 TaxID=3400806 RepID=UPI003C74EDE6